MMKIIGETSPLLRKAAFMKRSNVAIFRRLLCHFGRTAIILKTEGLESFLLLKVAVVDSSRN